MTIGGISRETAERLLLATPIKTLDAQVERANDGIQRHGSAAAYIRFCVTQRTSDQGTGRSRVTGAVSVGHPVPGYVGEQSGAAERQLDVAHVGLAGAMPALVFRRIEDAAASAAEGPR